MDQATTQAMLAAMMATMPYGKYRGLPLIDLPEPYVVWVSQQGFPAGLLGQQLALVYEIKLNGLETMLRPMLAQMTK
ncbi:DUF3820 family protein [Motilimonas pumila]|uniref:DUF3820 family protein n=1 Tax=Motilimonas pumila TaxID=2303987 RepID=A0A418YGC4_9GAMM|nr:DUF3820 family protein [Motilimonas pumila]RJG48667.1 hypothetical protein D1Z90_07345 [Motilimonas pumila]